MATGGAPDRDLTVVSRLATRPGQVARRVCLVCCGSVAAVKLPEVVAALLAVGVEVDAVLTDRACHFVTNVTYKGRTGTEALERLRAQHPGRVDVWTDADEWSAYSTVGPDPVLHVELARRSQALICAPMDAHTLAKAALGLCDNLAACIIRAWPYDLASDSQQSDQAGDVDGPCGKGVGSGGSEDRLEDEAAEAPHEGKPFLVAPAMNTLMWRQCITKQHLATLASRGVVVVEPVSKTLACGDEGKGAMASPEDIAAAVATALRLDTPPDD